MGDRIIKLDNQAEVYFHNNVDYCVGTGRMGLALTKEYLDQLKLVQAEIGFKHIRGHGLFCDDIAIYQEYEEDGVTKVEYNYRYLDRVFDEYIKIGLEPFIELGFMPGKLASGSQTIFYWKGNTTPPKDYTLWADMVQTLLRHLLDRYGERVYDWPIEVWNEPNLPGFWEHADMQEYFKLFKVSFEAVKAVDQRFKVGGPAVCGVQDELWIRSFLDFCKAEGLKPDSITRHHYTIEFPEKLGHYDYSKLMNFEEGFANLQTTRDITDSFSEFKGLPIHITEFSTSYTPKGVIHDTNLNAACIALQLSRLGDMNESYSYWTFGDVFEEQGVPFTPFYGGFGLLADGSIRKPTYWTFAFYKRLKDLATACIHKDASSVVVKTADGYAGILWNLDAEERKDRLVFTVEEGKEYTLITKTVDEVTCNPLKLWHDLGEPRALNEETLALLKSADKPLLASCRPANAAGSIELAIPVRSSGVVMFELKESKLTPDRGYDYNKVISTR